MCPSHYACRLFPNHAPDGATKSLGTSLPVYSLGGATKSLETRLPDVFTRNGQILYSSHCVFVVYFQIMRATKSLLGYLCIHYKWSDNYLSHVRGGGGGGGGGGD